MLTVRVSDLRAQLARESGQAHKGKHSRPLCGKKHTGLGPQRTNTYRTQEMTQIRQRTACPSVLPLSTTAKAAFGPRRFDDTKGRQLETSAAAPVDLFDIINSRHKPVLPTLRAHRTEIKCDRYKAVTRAKPFVPKGYRTLPLPSPLYQGSYYKTAKKLLYHSPLHEHETVTRAGAFEVHKLQPVEYTRLPSVTIGSVPVHVSGKYLESIERM
mmetsp:Transcript_8579/g.22129  ORF Transcript_8579/g.22129 Transcript_8579/m.22129 type:complete len:213 (+) Transcript_8579:37-675(+)